jgi:hypothetical protein
MVPTDNLPLIPSEWKKVAWNKTETTRPRTWR